MRRWLEANWRHGWSCQAKIIEWQYGRQKIIDFMGDLRIKLMGSAGISTKFAWFLPATQTFSQISHFQHPSALGKRSELTRDVRKIQDGHCCGPLRTLYTALTAVVSLTQPHNSSFADTCKELFHRRNLLNFHFFHAVDLAWFDALAPPTPSPCSKFH